MALQKPKSTELTEDLDKVKATIKRIDYYVVGIVIVTFFAFLTLLATISGIVIDAYRFKASTYAELLEKVNKISYEQEKRNEGDSQINLLKEQLNSLKQKNPYLK